MKKAFLLALLLGGCQTNAEIDRREAETYCRTSVAAGMDKDFAQCVASNVWAYGILRHYTPPPTTAAQAPASPVYYPQAQVPVSDAPALPNILPPTVRCQSVPAGLGTVQTVCR